MGSAAVDANGGGAISQSQVCEYPVVVEEACASCSGQDDVLLFSRVLGEVEIVYLTAETHRHLSFGLRRMADD